MAYIDRNKLLEAINSNVAEKHNERCVQLLNAILNAPTADVEEVKHGEWIDSNLYKQKECSVCHEGMQLYYAQPYCSECGTKMDGEGGEKT